MLVVGLCWFAFNTPPNLFNFSYSLGCKNLTTFIDA